MDIDAIVGTCNWEACSDCKDYGVNGCNKVAGPALKLHGEDVWCCDFKKKEQD